MTTRQRGARPDTPLAEAADSLFGPRRGRRIELGGRVQGVGFRPFVYRLAGELGIRGEVANANGTVRILAEGTAAALHEFERRLIEDAPPLAKPLLAESVGCAPVHDGGFRISRSEAAGEARVFVPPDCFLCADCQAEQADPADRRYRYPFINCTQCGPRYTLIESMPYDRPNTSMAGFPLCTECLAEYSDPADRRFHAEPVACAECGPQLRFETPGRRRAAHGEAALGQALGALARGLIVAVRGIGGYHLMCDAADPRAVAMLRRRKCRPDKPLAVMFPLAGSDGLAGVRRSVRPSRAEAAEILSPTRPIVLTKRRSDCALAPNVAPGLGELGVMLPYSPLHQLLLDGAARPLVATSGNLSGEPVLTDEGEASRRLGHIADAFLHHDRPIVRPADDSVLRRVGERLRPIRIGRGLAPLEMSLLESQPEPLVCVGGHMKATVSLSFDDRAVVSPHIGEMDSPRSLAVFEQLTRDLQGLYGVRAKRIACDAHPGYTSTRWAHRQDDLPVTPVWHHRAHAAALAGEYALTGDWLIFTWDGVGLGEDGTLWGGEALLGAPGRWRRVGSLRPFRPPGGERAARQPWRSAAALAWEAGIECGIDIDGAELAKQAWMRGINSPQTSAAGRLFDAAAALINGSLEVSYEAQGPMQLEALCRRPGTPLELALGEDADGVLRSDWRPLLDRMLDREVPAERRAEDFHSSMARVIVDQASAVRERHDFSRVGLTGGVFQNRVLTGLALEMLEAKGFEVRLNCVLPCNDAALSFGQAVEVAALHARDAI